MSNFENDEMLDRFAMKRISEFYPELKDLNICFLYLEKQRKSGDKIIAGRCCSVSDREYYLHSYDMIIEIDKNIWMAGGDKIRAAVMDHELNHIGIRKDEDGVIKFNEDAGRIRTYLKHHDLQEFSSIYERHGAYHDDIKEFIKAGDHVQSDEEGNDELLTEEEHTTG